MRAGELRLLERTGALFAQLFFIAAGVYLGNRADAWKEERGHREAARATLQNFRTELAANRRALAAQAPYHRQLAERFSAVMAGPPLPSLDSMFARVGWHGSGSVGFRHTAWDLALANQSLGYLDQRLAFAIADVYLEQQGFQRYQEITQQSLLSPANARRDMTGGVALILGVFYNDAVHAAEPGLERQYAALLPRLDSALAAAAR